MITNRDGHDEVPTPVDVRSDTTGRDAAVTITVATKADARAWAAATCATPDSTGGWSVTVRMGDTGAVRTALDTVTYRIRTEETPMSNNDHDAPAGYTKTVLDPDQLAAIRAEVADVLDVVVETTLRRSAEKHPGDAHAVGMLAGAELTRRFLENQLDHLARRLVVIRSDRDA